jgi:hypothetical protein
MEYMIMSAAPAVNPDFFATAKPESKKDPAPETLSEASERAIREFDAFTVNFLRTRYLEKMKAGMGEEKFDALSKKREERLVHWKEVTVDEKDIAKISPAQRDEILIEAVHLGMLCPHHPDHERAVELHNESMKRERAKTPQLTLL